MSGTKYQMTVLGVSLRMHVCVHVSYNRCEQQKNFSLRETSRTLASPHCLRRKYANFKTRALASNLRPPFPRTRPRPWRQTCHRPPLLPLAPSANLQPPALGKASAGIESMLVRVRPQIA